MKNLVKKTLISLFFLPLVINLSCINKQKVIELRKLSKEELLIRAQTNNLYPADSIQIIYRDSNSKIITTNELEKLSKEIDWALDYYVDHNGNLKEFVIRKATKSDIILKDSINRIIELNHIKKMEILTIDCDESHNLLLNSKDEDLQIVVSIIENCGLESLRKLNAEQLNRIWLTLQHNDNFYRKKYFKYIQDLVSENLLDKSSEAFMYDRILVQDGKEQIYGTQVVFNERTKKWEICPIFEPKGLNQRRKKMSLEPINDYLKHWNLEYKFE